MAGKQDGDRAGERIQRIMAEGQQVRRNMKRKRRVGAGLEGRRGTRSERQMGRNCLITGRDYTMCSKWTR